jgi:hypothetical protein
VRHSAEVWVPSARGRSGLAWLLATIVGVAVLLAFGASVMGLLNSVEPQPQPAAVPAPTPVLAAQPGMVSNDRVLVPEDDDRPWRGHGHGGRGKHKHGHKKHHNH